MPSARAGAIFMLQNNLSFGCQPVGHRYSGDAPARSLVDTNYTLQSGDGIQASPGSLTNAVDAEETDHHDADEKMEVFDFGRPGPGRRCNRSFSDQKRGCAKRPLLELVAGRSGAT
jgi:hypothetical protein